MTSSISPRHRAASAAVLAAGTAGIVAALLDGPLVALAVLTVLAAGTCLLLLDLRRRHQAAGRAQARLETRIDTLAEQLSSGVTKLSDGARDHRDAVTTLARDHRDAIAALARDLDESTRAAREQAATDAETTRDLLRRLDHEPVNEVQALLQLVPKVPGAPPLPAVGGWALTAASLLQVWHLVEIHCPRTIVECGSGTSTLWLAYAARQVEGARVVALDHDEGYAAATRLLLAEHGLLDIAEVRHAPLREVQLGEETVSWYDTDLLADVQTVDLLLVDGPPKWTGRLARFPAVPLLRDRLAPGAVILADDATRPEEEQAIRRWRTSYSVSAPERLSRDLVMLRCE